MLRLLLSFVMLRLVILDEPTSGLDPLHQKELYDFLAERSRNGRTIFMSSHVLSEVERVCDRVGIIRDGKIVAVQRIETLKDKMGQIVTVEFDKQPTVDDFRLPGVSAVQLTGRTLSLRVTGNHDQLLKALSRYKVTKLIAEEYSLDDLFLEYYQHDENHQQQQQQQPGSILSLAAAFY